MSGKLVFILIQIIFFFLAITVVSFFAEVLYKASRGNPFMPTFEHWVATEFVLIKVVLRFAASATYVLFRNRKVFYNR